MCINDAIDIIERLVKLNKQFSKNDIGLIEEYKKLWGKLEDLSRSESISLDVVDGIVQETKSISKLVKRHKFDMKYRILTTDQSRKMSIEDATEEVLMMRNIYKGKVWKHRTYQIVREDMVREVV